MADTILVKVQTLDRFGVVLLCSDDTRKLPTLKDYADAGWEMVQVTSDGRAGALLILRKERDP